MWSPGGCSDATAGSLVTWRMSVELKASQVASVSNRLPQE